MIKKCFTIAIVLMFVGEVLAAGFQLGFGGGYGFGAGRQDVGSSYEVNSNGDYTKYRDVRASYGNGIKLDLDATILFNDNFGLIIGTGFSMLGGYKLTGKGPDWEGETKMRANYLPITAGIKLQAGSGNVQPYLYIAPGIFIPIGTKGTDIFKAEGQPDEEDKMEEKYALGFGVSSGLGFLIKVSKVLGLKFECAPTYLFARLKEIRYEWDDGSKTTIILKKNEKKLPEDDITDPDDETYYYHGAPMFSFSSIAAKFGFLFSF